MTLSWFKQDLLGRLIVPLLLIAVYFPLQRGAHADQGWGGDYAGYLTQTRSIVEGAPMQPYYIYNPKQDFLAPPYYPLGYSILLVPFYRGVEADAMVWYSRFNSVLWWLCGLSLYVFPRKRFRPWAAFGAVLFLLFHPQMYYFKNFILPDVAYLLAMLWAAYWYLYRSHDKISDALACGFFTGLVWLMRANGVVCLIAIMGHQLIGLAQDWRAGKTAVSWKPALRYLAIVSALPVAMYLLVYRVLFTLPKGGGSYFDQLEGMDIWQDMFGNLEKLGTFVLRYYQLEPVVSFQYVHEKVGFAGLLAGALALGFIIIGLLKARGREDGFLLLLAAGMGGVLVIWPNSQEFRYLIPVFALMSYFLLKGITETDTPGRLAGPYIRIDRAIDGMAGEPEPGVPQRANNQEAFDYLRANTPDTAIVVYHHPLIMGLYGRRRSLRLTNATQEVMDSTATAYRVDYVLVNNWLIQSDPYLYAYLDRYRARYDTVWQNERNALLHVKKH